MTKTLFLSCVARMASLLGTAASSLLQDTLNLLNSNPSTGQNLFFWTVQIFVVEEEYSSTPDIDNKETCRASFLLRFQLLFRILSGNFNCYIVWLLSIYLSSRNNVNITFGKQ
jgi:hypothetical protein